MPQTTGSALQYLLQGAFNSPLKVSAGKVIRTSVCGPSLLAKCSCSFCWFQLVLKGRSWALVSYTLAEGMLSLAERDDTMSRGSLAGRLQTRPGLACRSRCTSAWAKGLAAPRQGHADTPQQAFSPGEVESVTKCQRLVGYVVSEEMSHEFRLWS